MQIVNVRQGDPAWHEFRAKHLNASEAPAMLGISKYKTRSDLLREKATGIVPDVDPETQKRFDAGHAAEAAGRPIVEAILGTELFPATAEFAMNGLPLGASFDGVSMDETVCWENKLANGHNADLQAVIDAEHWPQLEHQMIVAGTNQVFFTVSDGTEAGTRGIWYTSQPTRRTQVLAGWKQFASDLEHYEHVADASPAIASPVAALPAISVRVDGALVVAENFKIYEKALTEFLETGLIRQPKTDEDFATLEEQVKMLKRAEDALDAAEANMLAQVAAVDAAKRYKDALYKLTRDNRLLAERLVKTEKENRRAELVLQTQQKLSAHVAALNQRLGRPYMPAQDLTRFAAAIKGLKTIASTRSKLDAELANAKIAASADADKIEANLKSLRELAKDHAFLFHDAAQLVLKANDDLVALVKTRIADHKVAEDARIQQERDKAVEAERERLRQEELARQQTSASVPVATPTPAVPAPEPVREYRMPLPAATAPVAPESPRLMSSEEWNKGWPTPSPSASDIDDYMETISVGPNHEKLIRRHLAAFLQFCAQRKVAA